MRGSLAIIVLACGAWPAAAQQASLYALQLLTPTAIGAFGTGHDADHRMYRAYTGVPYNIRATANGGTWPYTFTLASAPAGMTVVNATANVTTCGRSTTNLTHVDCGEIIWANPTTTATNLQVCVIDTVLASDCETFTITVQNNAPGAGNFTFIDNDCAGCDATGAGTLASPWQTLTKARASAGARSIVYFRNSTTPYAMPASTGSPADCVAEVTFDEATQPVIWIAYPGEIVVLDQASTGPCADMTGQNIYIDEIDTINCRAICYQMHRSDQFGMTVRRVNFNGQGPGIASGNSSFIEFSRSDGLPTFADIVQNNTFTNLNYGNGNSCVKIYSTNEMVVEDNSATNIHTVLSEVEGCLAVKDSAAQFTIRNNELGTDFPATIPCISGNMHTTSGIQVSGEIYFNNCLKAGDDAYNFNQDGQAGRIDHWRNTWQGTVTARNVETGDGPYTFTQDVMVNAGGSGGSCPVRLTCSAVTDYSLLTVTNLLTGVADGSIVVQATGFLTGASLSFLGTRGWQFGVADTLIRLRQSPNEE